MTTEELDYRRRRKERNAYFANYRRQRKANGNPVTKTTPQLSKFARGEVIAWDGEAVTENGEHKYVLLSNSLGDRIVNPDGLSTGEVLKFLTDVGSKHRRAIHVSYGFSYDVNMIIKDLSKKQLTSLWNDGYTTYDDVWRIWYTWRRELRIHRLGEPLFIFSPKYNKVIPNVEASITIWDTLGFSQSSFVKAIQQWLPNLPEEDVRFIEEMKSGRSTFSYSELSEIERYNDMENKFLVKIHHQILDAHSQAGVTLLRHDGAGSSAAAWLKKYHVKGYMADEPAEVYLASRFAYFGGRIEACQIGNAEHKTIYRYDINSAYPSVITTLPCLNHGRWEYVPGEQVSEIHPMACYHIRFADSYTKPFYPLPYRMADGSILFPEEVEGWYWSPEVSLLNKGQIGDFEILEGWEYHRNCSCQPFAWIPELYKLRQKFKAEGNHAQYAIKLGLNALYGKFAQQVGMKRSGRPTYHQLAWAGFITSATRAKMYELASQSPQSIVAFATDGILSTTKLQADIGTELGQWEEEKYNGLTIVQAGIYWLRKGDDWEVKYRGFDQGSLVRDAILEAWRNGGSYFATVTRFVGLGSALSSDNYWDRWRTWDTSARELNIYPIGKRFKKESTKYLARKLVRTSPAMNMTPEIISEPHAVSWQTDQLMRESIDGIDIKILEGEFTDTWA